MNRRKSRPFFVFFISVASSLFSGCYKPHPVIPAEILRLPMPTKDEVALVDDRALTIQDYYMIRSKLQTPSSDHALWVGISMLALQNKTRFDGDEISIQAAFDIARYAIRDLPPSNAAASLREYYKQTPSLPDPEEVKKEMEALSQKSIVRRNPVPLSQFN